MNHLIYFASINNVSHRVDVVSEEGDVGPFKPFKATLAHRERVGIFDSICNFFEEWEMIEHLPKRLVTLLVVDFDGNMFITGEEYNQDLIATIIGPVVWELWFPNENVAPTGQHTNLVEVLFADGRQEVFREEDVIWDVSLVAEGHQAIAWRHYLNFELIVREFVQNVEVSGGMLSEEWPDLYRTYTKAKTLLGGQ